MKDLSTISRIVFLGIGGIGMSAIARYFLQRGAVVSGYDRVETELTKALQREGATIHFTDDVSFVDAAADLIVYTPALPAGHQELSWYRTQGFEVMKRSQVLGQITADSTNICVAGTHGKTTISSMIAHLLTDSNYGCQAFLGGISINYQTNYLNGNPDVCVVEADEYDRSFLALSPSIAVITATDADHMDIYHSEERLVNAYEEFAGKIKSSGLLIYRYGGVQGTFTTANQISYSLQNTAAGAYAQNIRMKQGGYEFEVVSGSWQLPVRIRVGAMHNVENMVAAVAVARYLEIDDAAIQKAVENYKGVRRRFEYVIDAAQAAKHRHDVVLIDDYAHHPEELKALLKSVKALFSARKCTIIFQPHLYSRTRDMAADFAAALDLADEVLLLPIYPAREEPIGDVSSEWILRKMKQQNASVLSKDQVLEYISGAYLHTVEKSPYGQLLILAGAGDIDALVSPIKNILRA